MEKKINFEIDEVYTTKFQTRERVLLKEIITNDKGDLIRFGVIYEKAPHLGICPLGKDRLFPKNSEYDSDLHN